MRYGAVHHFAVPVRYGYGYSRQVRAQTRHGWDMSAGLTQVRGPLRCLLFVAFGDAFFSDLASRAHQPRREDEVSKTQVVRQVLRRPTQRSPQLWTLPLMCTIVNLVMYCALGYRRWIGDGFRRSARTSGTWTVLCGSKATPRL